MTTLATTALPQITVERIQIENDKVTVNAYLTTRDGGQVPYFMNEKYFSDFIKIYLLLVPDDNSVLRRKLSDPKTRVANIISEEGTVVTDIELQWFDRITEGIDYKTISLSEATNQDSESNVTSSRIRGTNAGPASGLSDISFNVDIPFSTISLSNQSFENLHLYVFSHLDVAGLVSEYNLSPDLLSTVNLLGVGGNLSTDKILETNQNQKLRVPTQVTILTYDDGTPFVGAYHYHDGDGPNDYTGYMEGSRDHMTPSSRTLKSLSVPYKKVVANFLIEDDLFISGYNYSQDELDLLENNYVSPFVADESALGMVFQESNAYDQNALLKAYDPEFQQTLLDRRFEQSLNVGTNGIIFNSIHSIHTEQFPETGQIPYHRIEFEIDFKKLLKTRSKYPFFLNKLQQNLGVSVETVLLSARVLEFSIYRRRLTNLPRSNNPIGNAAYENYEEDAEVLVLRTRYDENSLYQVEEILDFEEARRGQSRKYNVALEHGAGNNSEIRKFVIKDYKAAREINFGKYAYRLKIVVEDSIKDQLQGFFDDFKNQLSTYDQFLLEASIPDRPSGGFNGSLGMFLDTNEEETPEGNLNIYTENYTDSFKSRSRTQYDDRLRSLIASYTRLHAMLTDSESVDMERINHFLATAIIPADGGTYSGALKFRKRMTQMIMEYENILQRDNIISPGGQGNISSDLIPSGNKHPGGANTGLIEFSRDIPGYSESFNVGEVMFSFGVEDLLNSARISDRDPILATSEEVDPFDPADPDRGGDGLWATPASAVYSSGEEIENAVDFEEDDSQESDRALPDGFLDFLLNSPIERTADQIKMLNESVLNGTRIDPALLGVLGNVFFETNSTNYSTREANNSNPDGEKAKGLADAGGLLGVFGQATGNNYNASGGSNPFGGKDVAKGLAKKNGPGTKNGNAGQMNILVGRGSSANFVPMTAQTVKQVEATGVTYVTIKVDTPQAARSTNNVTTISMKEAKDLVGLSSSNNSSTRSGGSRSRYTASVGTTGGLRNANTSRTSQLGGSIRSVSSTNTSTTQTSRSTTSAPRRY